MELIKNALLKHSILSCIISDLRKYAGYEIIIFCQADAGRYNKMTADIVKCCEVDADLVMLCRTSECTADADC